MGTRASWSIHARLLPYLEQDNAYQQIDIDKDWHAQVHTGVTFFPVTTYLCPSEPNQHHRTRNGRPYVGPHSYGFNSGVWFIYHPVSESTGSGAFVVNRATRPADLDGTPGQLKLRPGLQSNTGHTVWPDGRVHHAGVTTTFTPNTFVPYTHGGQTYDIDVSTQQEGKSGTIPTRAAITSRSYHPGNVNTLLMDASISVTDDSVDLAAWRALGTRYGGE